MLWPRRPCRKALCGPTRYSPYFLGVKGLRQPGCVLDRREHTKPSVGGCREPSSPACFSANLSLADARCLLSSSLTSRGLQSVLPVLLNKVQRHTPRVQGSLMATGILFFTAATKPRSQSTQPGNQRALVLQFFVFHSSLGLWRTLVKLPKWFPEEHFFPHGVSTPTGKAGRHQWRRVLKITVFRKRPDQELGHTDTAKVNFDVTAIFDPGTAISWILVTTDRTLFLTTIAFI